MLLRQQVKVPAPPEVPEVPDVPELVPVVELLHAAIATMTRATPKPTNALPFIRAWVA